MLDTQTTFLITIVIIAVLLIAAFVYDYYAYLTKARLSDELPPLRKRTPDEAADGGSEG